MAWRLDTRCRVPVTGFWGRQLNPENKDRLAAILTYHVVPGKVRAADVVKRSKAKRAQGSEVKIKVKDGKVQADHATVTAIDIACSNGVIHVISDVIPNARSDASRPRGAITRCADSASALRTNPIERRPDDSCNSRSIFLGTPRRLPAEPPYPMVQREEPSIPSANHFRRCVMFRKLAAAVVVVVLSAGSVAQAGGADGGQDWEIFLHSPRGAFDEDPFFDLYPPRGLTDAGANGLYDSPGDDTFEPRSPFFDVLIQRERRVIDNGEPGIIDDGDAGVMTDALWLELLMSMGW